MLQILLAFLAISIVSVTGYGLVEQMSLQQIMTDQRENLRRLDVAADAIQGRLVTMPGVEGVFAPAPNNLASGWSYMPSGMGGINATVAGVPFAYCPVAFGFRGDDDNSVVKMAGGGEYAVQVKSGVVVGSSLGNSQAFAPGITAYKPVAFILAARRGFEQPPSCDAVRERNGRPYAEGGLVRIVSIPAGAQGPGTVNGSTSDLFVASGVNGSGRLNDPASIDDALLQWINFRPSVMTIHLAGDVTVADPEVWTKFVAAANASPGRLTIDGGGHSLTAPSGQMGAPGTFSLSSVALIGPTIVVGQGDEMNVLGAVSLQTGVNGSGVVVQQGGRLNITGGVMRVSGSADNGVEVAGDVSMNGGGIASTGGWSLGLSDGGRLSSRSSQIGDAGARNSQAGLVVSGAWSVVSDADSRVAASGGGTCWAALVSTDATFAYSQSGPGARSAVFADPVNPGLQDPSNPIQAETYQEYRRQVDGRQRSRQTNHSNFLCV